MNPKAPEVTEKVFRYVVGAQQAEELVGTTKVSRAFICKETLAHAFCYLAA